MRDAGQRGERGDGGEETHCGENKDEFQRIMTLSLYQFNIR